ncbi:hypothetical protein T02_13401 [Trichinella nativa]|uniref:Uncharacterized protein n=1 Tax=Trichinella nativa TaxID=6335 RepID=A0A0V1KY17_9BILA|nr:hypothetical protein T02_13401 [Trichinella nativa]
MYCTYIFYNDHEAKLVRINNKNKDDGLTKWLHSPSSTVRATVVERCCTLLQINYLVVGQFPSDLRFLVQSFFIFFITVFCCSDFYQRFCLRDLHKQHFVTCPSCSKGTSCGIILIFSRSYDSMCMCEWFNVVVVQTHKLFLYQSRSYLSVFMLCFAFDLKIEVKFILLSSFRVAYRVEKNMQFKCMHFGKDDDDDDDDADEGGRDFIFSFQKLKNIARCGFRGKKEKRQGKRRGKDVLLTEKHVEAKASKIPFTDRDS